MITHLTSRDCAIISRALEIAGVAEVGDAVGGNDRLTNLRMQALSECFEQCSVLKGAVLSTMES